MTCKQNDILKKFGITIDSFHDNLESNRIYYIFITHAHSDHLSFLKKTPFQNYNIILYMHKLTFDIIISDPKYNWIAKYVKYFVFDNRNISNDKICFSVIDPLNRNHETKIKVIAINANHCMGSCMYLFNLILHVEKENDKNIKILYTGDFRWDKSIHSNIITTYLPIQHVYYDDTFENKENSIKIPSYNDSFQNFYDLFQKLLKTNKQIYLQSHILGIEKLIISLIDKNLSFQCYISKNLSLKRINQIKSILSEYNILTENIQEANLILDRFFKNSSSRPWILINCYMPFLFQKTKSHVPKEKDVHHLWYCSHSNYFELQEFKQLFSSQPHISINKCDYERKDLFD